MSFLLYRFTSKFSLYRPSLLYFLCTRWQSSSAKLNFHMCLFLSLSLLFICLFLFIFMMFQLLHNFFLSIWGPEIWFRAWKKKVQFITSLRAAKSIKGSEHTGDKSSWFQSCMVFFLYSKSVDSSRKKTLQFNYTATRASSDAKQIKLIWITFRSVLILVKYRLNAKKCF